jgi:hypothetical protein
MVDLRDQPDRPVPQTSNRSTSEITAFDLIGTWFSRMARRATMLANPKRKKSPAATAGLFVFQGGG